MATTRRSPSSPGAGLSEVARWKTWLEIAKKAQAEWTPLWDRADKYYKNEITPRGKQEAQIQITVALAFAYVRTAIPSLYFRDPYVSINPQRPQDFLAARVAEAALNDQLARLQLKREVKRALFDAVVRGHGVVKWGYRPELSETPEGPLATGDELFVSRVSPRDFFWHPQAAVLTESPWVIQRLIRPLDEVKQDKTLQHTASLKGGISLSPAQTPSTVSAQRMDDVSTQIELFEIWNVRDKTLLVVTPESDELLRRDPWPVQKWTRVPYDVLTFNAPSDSLYSVPDLLYVEAQLLELTALRTMQISHLKKFVRQYLYQKGAVKREDSDKIEQAIDGALIEVANINAIKALDYGALPTDFGAAQRDIKADFREVLGQDETARGAPLPEKRTLGEVELIRSGGVGRREERVDVLEDHLEVVSRGLLDTMQEKFDRARMVQLTGEPALAWPPGTPSPEDRLRLHMTETGFTFTRQDLQGDFEVEVRAGSTLPLNKEGQLRRIAALTEDAKSFPEIVDIREVLREKYRLLEIKNLDRLIRPQPPAAPGGLSPSGGGPAPGAPALGLRPSPLDVLRAAGGGAPPTAAPDDRPGQSLRGCVFQAPVSRRGARAVLRVPE